MTTKTAGDRDPSRFNSAIRQLYAGGSNNTGQVTLTANATSTVVAHQSCNPKSHISLTPLTANALIAQSPSVALTAKAVKFLSFSRVLSAANGNVSYTGVGFQPVAIRFEAGDTLNTNTFGELGLTDGTTTFRHQLSLGTATVAFDNTHLMTLAESGANFQSVDLVSFDVDGFTLSYTKTGTPTHTFNVVAICFPPAAALVSSGGVYVSARTTGSFTLTHASSPNNDQTFSYSVTGGA